MSEENQKRIIEIDGVKLEIDMRTAKRVDNFRVGSRVKVLVPDRYNSDKKAVEAGVIVGFEEFKSLPTIVVAYVQVSYNEASIKMLYINEENNNVEMILADNSYLPFKKAEVVQLLDREILKKQDELDDLQRRKDYFLTQFGSYFSTAEETKGL